MNAENKTCLGTISIYLSLIPFLAFISWLLFNPPCGTTLRSLLENMVIYGTLCAFPVGILAVIKDKPKIRAVIGLTLSSFIVLCFFALVGASVYAIATGSSGTPGVVEFTYGSKASSFEAGHFQTTEMTYYDIHGSTLQELNDQMVHLGPKGYFAETNSFYAWKYDYLSSNGSCAITRVRVETKITYTYPRWDAAGAGEDVLKGWNKSYSSLEAHENEHGQIANRGGQEIYDALTQLAPAVSCDELDRTVKVRGNAIIDEAQKNQEEFDRVTDHGRIESPGSSF